MDIGLLNQYYHELVIRNSDSKSNHPEYIKKYWMMINKNLNDGMVSEKYGIIHNHALNLVDEVFKVILGSAYTASNHHDNLGKLIASGYPIETQERLDYLKVVSDTCSNFERLTFSLKSIGQILHKLGILGKEDIELNSDRLRAEVGEVIEGKCTITKFIGASDGGRVLEAIYLGRVEKVAVKEISRTAYPLFHYENEKKILMALDHQRIVKIHDVLRDNQTYYIVMDFIEGTTLTAYIEAQGKLELPLVIKLTKELVEMINYLNNNKCGKIYADLNPDNIMIDQEKHLHLIDFRVNYNKKPKHDKISMFTGGANYLSPELIEGKDSDLQSDIFSVGGIIYYMAEGRKPIPGNRQTFRTTTDYTLVGIIEKAMAKNLKLRYLNISKFVYDIKLFEASLEKNDSGEHTQKDNPNIQVSPERSNRVIMRNMPENKSKPPENKSQEGKKKNAALNFGAQLFLGILFISGIIVFMYFINNLL